MIYWHYLKHNCFYTFIILFIAYKPQWGLFSPGFITFHFFFRSPIYENLKINLNSIFC